MKEGRHSWKEQLWCRDVAESRLEHVSRIVRRPGAKEIGLTSQHRREPPLQKMPGATHKHTRKPHLPTEIKGEQPRPDLLQLDHVCTDNLERGCASNRGDQERGARDGKSPLAAPGTSTWVPERRLHRGARRVNVPGVGAA